MEPQTNEGPSMSDTCQNQLAKCPNRTSCSKEKFAGRTPVDLLGLGARQLFRGQLSVPPRKAYVGSQCRAGEKQGGAPKQMVPAAPRNIPLNPPLGASKPLQQAPRSHPGGVSSRQRLCLENPGEPDIARAQPHVGSLNLLAKVGPAARRSKANKEQVWWKGKLALFQRPATWRGGQTPVQRPTPTHTLTISGQELL